MGKPIFISYRRDDSAAEAAALYRELRGESDEDLVFMDTSTVEPGRKWTEEIESALESAETIIAVIGPDWIKASNEWGQRRIDQKDDWVRREILFALNSNKKIIPTFVRGARQPPKEVLPKDIDNLFSFQSIELRRDYWQHDVQLLLAQFPKSVQEKQVGKDSEIHPYPEAPPIGPDPIKDEKLLYILESNLPYWKRIVSPLPENNSQVREELFREYKFDSFQDTINFMFQVAPGCDIANHHPRWENIWKTLRVYLSTWDISHKITDRDIQLARYFDQAYKEFSGSKKRRDAAEKRLSHNINSRVKKSRGKAENSSFGS